MESADPNRTASELVPSEGELPDGSPEAAGEGNPLDEATEPKGPESAIEPYDFRSPSAVAASELRKLRVQQAAFAHSLASRLSIYLRMEFGLELTQLQTQTYHKFVQEFPNPCHLSLFKIEPWRGICLLEISPRLGLAMIDRLMGGAGRAEKADRDLSEVETALLDQVVQMILTEWCNPWIKFQELRPVLVGHENTGRFLQTSAPDAMMLVLLFEARLGECVEPVRIGFPITTLEPAIHALGQTLASPLDQSSSSQPLLKPKWNREFDEVMLPVVAEWSGMRLPAREIAKLKAGDVIPLPSDFASRVQLSLGGTPRFYGRLGSCDHHWAIELTETART
jgi:flagellar motor switch protein FliM